MREWLKTTIHAFWVSFGVILSFIFVGIISAIMILTLELIDYFLFSQTSQSQNKFVNNPPGLKIDRIEYRKSDSMAIFVGEIKKIDDKNYHFVTVTVELLDENNQYVDKCEEYISSSFDTTETVTFKVSCGGGCGYPNLHFSKYSTTITATIRK
jgi:hypothetical protein